MIYGRLLNSIKTQEVTNESNEFDITSVVYDEYLNRKAMLEACTVEADKAVLEAQVNILYEVSIKDIFGAIKKAIRWIIDKISELLNRIKDFFESAINKGKSSWKDIKDKLSGKIKLHESVLIEVDNKDLKDLKPATKINIIDRITEKCREIIDADEMYFKIDDYYRSEDAEASSLNRAMKEFISKLRSNSDESELREDAENFKNKYANKKKIEAFGKSDFIARRIGQGEGLSTSDEALINFGIQYEKANKKLKSFEEICVRAEDIAENHESITKLNDYIKKLSGYIKDLESACDTCENVIQRNAGEDNYKNISSIISDLNSMFRINISCYSSAIKYFNLLINKAEQSRAYSFKQRIKMLNILNNITEGRV